MSTTSDCLEVDAWLFTQASKNMNEHTHFTYTLVVVSLVPDTQWYTTQFNDGKRVANQVLRNEDWE